MECTCILPLQICCVLTMHNNNARESAGAEEGGVCVGNRFPLSITKDHYLSFLVYSADNQGLYNWGTYRCGGGVGETGTRSTYAR